MIVVFNRLVKQLYCRVYYLASYHTVKIQHGEDYELHRKIKLFDGLS